MTTRAARWPSYVALALTLAALTTAYVTVGALLGAAGEPLAATWQNAIGLLVVAVAARPIRHWLDEGVHELASQHHEPYAAIRAIAAPTVPGTPTLASAIARAAHLDWVEVDLDGAESVGVRLPGRSVVEIPIAYDDQRLGLIRTAERSPGRGITKADRQVLEELARQLALRIVAERAAARVLESRNQLVAAREEERLRIRRDLHDGLAPSLASIHLQLKALQRGLGERDPMRASIDGLLADIAGTSADLRRLVYDLRPPLLDELGIAGALTHQLAGIEEPRMRITVEVADLPAAVEVALFRIATEAVRNTVRHARASEVTVTIERTGGVVRLTVADDGIGIAGDVVPGVGLTAMRERADEVGGSLTLHAAPGRGTTVVAELREPA